MKKTDKKLKELMFKRSSKAIGDILNSESQGDISASTDESDILHPVVERDVTRSSSTETNEEDVNRALKNIIDCENKFYCFDRSVDNLPNCDVQCSSCNNFKNL